MQHTGPGLKNLRQYKLETDPKNKNKIKGAKSTYCAYIFVDD